MLQLHGVQRVKNLDYDKVVFTVRLVLFNVVHLNLFVMMQLRVLGRFDLKERRFVILNMH